MLNTKVKLTAISLIFVLSACSSLDKLAKLNKGENLITPYSGFFKDWQVSINNSAGFYSQYWQHPKLGAANTYVVTVSPIDSKSLKYYQQVIDQPGNISCDQFNSTDVVTDQNRYKNRLWQTQCIHQSRQTATVIHLLIQGNKSLYHLQKIWRYQPKAELIQVWQQRFQQVYLCNTQDENFPCPSQLQITN